MAQVAAAAGAHDLGADHAVRRSVPQLDGLGDRGVGEARPAGAGVELVVGAEQLGAAAGAAVDAVGSLASTYLPVNGGSVACWRRTAYWSGVELLAPLIVGLRDLVHARQSRVGLSTLRRPRFPATLACLDRAPPSNSRDERLCLTPTDKTRYIFVTGGVVSSLGKGIAAASIGRLLVSRGLTVGLQKFDPYINVDPGTMSPYQHGEVFVTEDGAETDLDLGHYERYTDSNTSRASNVTAGGIYNSVIRRERRGDYLGGTVQVVPHITDEIKQRIRLIAETSDVDVVITEIGGTVGDIESLPFLEAIRQFPVDVGRRNTACTCTSRSCPTSATRAS